MPLTTVQLSALIDTLDTEIALRISGKPPPFSQSDKSLSRMSREELENLRTSRVSEYNSKLAEDSVAADTGNPNKIKTQMTK